MIKLETYISGSIEKSPTGYSYFVPTKINDQWSWENQQINSLVE